MDVGTTSAATVCGVTGHVFISYHHEVAGAYVRQLAAYLAHSAVNVWYDHEIITDDRSTHLLRDKIDSCAAVVVVMTPKAEQSDWVRREIDQAEQTRRPILPLLLDGSRFFTLADLQYENVNGNAMPSAGFVRRLRRESRGCSVR